MPVLARCATPSPPLSPADTITFAPNLGPITLTSGELLITTSLTISGPPTATQTISGAGLSRIFEITPTAALTLTDLAITDGHAPAASGDSNPGGGGILNNGTLIIANSRVVSNTAGMGTLADDSAGEGGAILNNGALSISESTVMSNSAGEGDPLYDDSNGGSGGGIANTGTLTITTSAIMSNTGGQGTPGSYASGDGGSGGGIASDGTLTMMSSTVSGNAGGNSSSVGSDNGIAGAGGSGGGIANSWI